MKKINILAAAGVLAGLLAVHPQTRANEATIIGVYEDCQPASSTVILSDEIEGADRITAQAEAAAGAGRNFEQALPRIIASLESNGVKDISVQRRGICSQAGQGQFVEAIIGYCDNKVSRAEVLIDGNLFFSRSGTQVDFDTFISEAREKLLAIGITGDPRMSLSSNVDCGQESSN